MALYEYNGKRPILPEDGSAFIAPSADLIGDVHLGKRTSIWFGVVIRADHSPIVVGDDSNIQEQSMLHADPGIPLTIGKGVTVGHQAMLHGCTIGDNVLIGMGATLLNNCVIPDNCIVGAGALVTEGKTFPEGSLIVGVPAQAKRQLDEAAIKALGKSASGYAELGAKFARGLKRVDPG